MGRVLNIFILIFIPIALSGQFFLELHTQSDDSYREWELVMEDDSTELYGELLLTWGINNDFSEWQYSVEEYYGEIVQKFKNNSGFWELRSEGKVVTIQQVWPGDPTEWKISHAGRSFTFRSVYSQHLDDWAMVDKEFGELVMYSDSRGDPRDWMISDYTVDAITFEERMAAIFIGIFVSTPKF